MSTSDSSFRSHFRFRRQQGSSLTFPLAVLAIGSVAVLTFVIMRNSSSSTDPHHEAATDAAWNEATGQSVPSNAAAAAGGGARLGTSDSARGDSGSATNQGADSDDTVLATGDDSDSSSDSNSEGAAHTNFEASRRGFSDASSRGLDLRSDRTGDPAERDAALPPLRGGSSSAADTATEAASDAATEMESAAKDAKRQQENARFGSDIFSRIRAIDGRTIIDYRDIAAAYDRKGPDDTFDITYENDNGEIVTETTSTVFCCNDAEEDR